MVSLAQLTQPDRLVKPTHCALFSCNCLFFCLFDITLFVLYELLIC